MTVNKSDLEVIAHARHILALTHVEPDGSLTAKCCGSACQCPAAVAWNALLMFAKSVDMAKVTP